MNVFLKNTFIPTFSRPVYSFKKFPTGSFRDRLQGRLYELLKDDGSFVSEDILPGDALAGLRQLRLETRRRVKRELRKQLDLEMSKEVGIIS